MVLDYRSITLGLSRSSFGKSKKNKGGAGLSGSISSSAKPAELNKDLKQKILEKQDHTCQYCGFRAEKYQEIVFANDDPSDHSEANLQTACIFCHQCFNLDQVGALRSAGVLVWLPEIEQADLHHIARAIYVARISQGAMADVARKVLDVLMQRREVIRDRIGTDDPHILAMVMKDYLSDAHYAQRAQKIDGIRLFPLDRRIIREAELEFNQFPQILAYWRSKAGPFGGKPPQKWFDIFHDIQAAS